MKKIVCLYLLSNLCLFADFLFVNNDVQVQKIKKLVDKEEYIAQELTKYINNKALIPSLEDLNISDDNFFGSKIAINSDLSIDSNIGSNVSLNDYARDYYYTNENRVYTISSFFYTNSNIKLKYDKKREFIKKLLDEKRIVYSKPSALMEDVYYFAPSGDLRYFHKSSKARFVLNNEDLVVDEDEVIEGSATEFEEFKNLVNDVLFIGQRIFHLKNGSFEEYIYLGDLAGLKKLKSVKDTNPEPIPDDNVNKALIDFSNNGAGMIINGDLYSWGNNKEFSTGIALNTIVKSNGNKETSSSKAPVVTVPIKARVKSYDDYSKVDDENWYNSPFRVKFKDLTASSQDGLCATTFEGYLYCNGYNNLEYSEFDGYSRGKDRSILYRHRSFNETNKASKIFAFEYNWLSLANTILDENNNERSGNIYIWNGNNNYGLLAIGSAYSHNWYRTPQRINIPSEQGFQNLDYTKEIGYRRVFTLANSGDIYFWGLDSNSTGGVGNSYCTQVLYDENLNNIGYINYCLANKIDAFDSASNKLIFTSIKASQRAVLAKATNTEFYKISQEYPKKVKAQSIKELLGSNYNSLNDGDIIAVDFSNKINDSSLSGIVWINEHYELKGDLYTAENVNDEIFNEAIKSMKWKKIRVINNQNGMCAINSENQMYCWGVMSSITKDLNTFLLPVFNTNIYDEEEDLMVGRTNISNSEKLPHMTSGEWKKRAYAYENQFF